MFFVVKEEGGLYTPVSLLGLLLSDAPIWGFMIGGCRYIHDSILTRYGMNPWRTNNWG